MRLTRTIPSATHSPSETGVRQTTQASTRKLSMQHRGAWGQSRACNPAAAPSLTRRTIIGANTSVRASIRMTISRSGTRASIFHLAESHRATRTSIQAATGKHRFSIARREAVTAHSEAAHRDMRGGREPRPSSVFAYTVTTLRHDALWILPTLGVEVVQRCERHASVLGLLAAASGLNHRRKRQRHRKNRHCLRAGFPSHYRVPHKRGSSRGKGKGEKTKSLTAVCKFTMGTRHFQRGNKRDCKWCAPILLEFQPIPQAPAKVGGAGRACPPGCPMSTPRSRRAPNRFAYRLSQPASAPLTPQTARRTLLPMVVACTWGASIPADFTCNRKNFLCFEPLRERTVAGSQALALAFTAVRSPKWLN